MKLSLQTKGIQNFAKLVADSCNNCQIVLHENPSGLDSSRSKAVNLSQQECILHLSRCPSEPLSSRKAYNTIRPSRFISAPHLDRPQCIPVEPRSALISGIQGVPTFSISSMPTLQIRNCFSASRRSAYKPVNQAVVIPSDHSSGQTKRRVWTGSWTDGLKWIGCETIQILPGWAVRKERVSGAFGTCKSLEGLTNL